VRVADVVSGLAGVSVEVALDLEQVGEHFERVPMDVEVVVGVLADPAQPVELREHLGGGAELVEELEPAQRIGAGDQQPQLGQLPFAGGLARADGDRPRERDELRVELELELSAEAGGAHDPQRIGGKAPRRDGPQHPRLEVGAAAKGIDRLGSRVAELDRDRVDGEVALAEVGDDRVAAQGAHVDMPGAVRGQHPPGTELGRKLERRTARRAGDPPRRIRSVTVHSEVEVDDRSPAERVADGTADDPERVVGAGERLASARGRGRVEQRPARRPRHREPASLRGTRGEIPQVIS
jgi:hypothetical protein